MDFEAALEAAIYRERVRAYNSEQKRDRKARSKIATSVSSSNHHHHHHGCRHRFSPPEEVGCQCADCSKQGQRRRLHRDKSVLRQVCVHCGLVKTVE
jgi:hypothetical protein